MMNYNTIQVYPAAHEGYIYLNRPDKHNAMNREMISEIRDAIGELNRAPSIRLIVISAKGKSFSSGADLTYMREQGEMTVDENRADSLDLAGMFYEIYSSPLPVITVSHGNIAGGAIGIIAACDYALTSQDSIFKFSEVQLGLVPATIAPYVMDRIGRSRSAELMLTARSFFGIEAERYGLVNKSVAREELAKELQVLLNLFRKTAPEAVKKTKQLLLEINDSDRKEKLIDITSAIIAEARASDEGKEGLNAFFEKRKAGWVNENI